MLAGFDGLGVLGEKDCVMSTVFKPALAIMKHLQAGVFYEARQFAVVEQEASRGSAKSLQVGLSRLHHDELALRLQRGRDLRQQWPV